MYSTPPSIAEYRINQAWLRLLLKYQILTGTICTFLWLVYFIARVSHDEIFKISTLYGFLFIFFARFLPVNLGYGFCFWLGNKWYFRTHALTQKSFTSMAFVITLIIAIPMSALTHKLWYEGLYGNLPLVYPAIALMVQLLFNTFYLPCTLFHAIS